MTKNKEQKRVLYVGYRDNWTRLIATGEIPEGSILISKRETLLGMRDFEVIWGFGWVRLPDAELIHKEIELRK